MLPKTVHTSITGTGSDYYDISCPGIKYGAAVIVQFASQRNEYYILNADAMADNTVRIRVNKAVPAGTGIYVNAIYSVNSLFLNIGMGFIAIESRILQRYNKRKEVILCC